MKTLHTQATVLLKKLFKLERCGKYDEALAELKDIWNDTTTFPNIEEFEPRIAAEIILRCGSIIGFLGHNKQIPNSQEKSKNLLTEARNRFLDIYDVEKIAECENYLALAYWRTGELEEAEAFIEGALSHNLHISNNIRIYSYLTRSLIFLSSGRYEEILIEWENLNADFQKYGDAFLNGSFCTNSGLALKNLGKTPEALKRLELARFYHQKSRHQIYLGTVENNLAQLYKLENRFIEAHEVVNNSTKIFKQIKDRTREGFSLDTKAQIYFAEKKYTEALSTSEKAINILKKSENKAYLVESYLTKAKTLIYLEDEISTAILCLVDAVELTRTNISEEAAKDLIREFENTWKEKNSPIVEETLSEKEAFAENLELLLPPSLAHYNDLQGVWIKNNHLESVGLRKDSLAIVAQEKIKRGDLAAIAEIANDSISCGFYDSDFGIVCLEGVNSEVQLFDEKDTKILGKIIGVCKSEKSADGKTIVEPLNL
jgi:tetratricopeptide (TPR) repeat protein